MLSQMNGCHVPGNRSHTEPGLQANWHFPLSRPTRCNAGVRVVFVSNLTKIAMA